MATGKPDRQARDRLIRELRAQGIPWRKIATVVGLTIRQAQRALERDADAVSAADQEYVEGVKLREEIVRTRP